MLTSRDSEFVEKLVVLRDVSIQTNELTLYKLSLKYPVDFWQGYQALSDRIVGDSGLSIFVLNVSDKKEFILLGFSLIVKAEWKTRKIVEVRCETRILFNALTNF